MMASYLKNIIGFWIEFAIFAAVSAALLSSVVAIALALYRSIAAVL